MRHGDVLRFHADRVNRLTRVTSAPQKVVVSRRESFEMLSPSISINIVLRLRDMRFLCESMLILLSYAKSMSKLKAQPVRKWCSWNFSHDLSRLQVFGVTLSVSAPNLS